MGNPRKTPEHRFWQKVDKTDGCWEWTGSKKRRGYVEFFADGKTCLAHRWSYEAHNGPIPPGLFVCHKCDNPCCVRPDHLFVGTAKDNMQDCSKKGRLAPPHPGLKYKGKLTLEQVSVIRRLRSLGFLQRELGEMFGCTGANISHICRGFTYSAV